MPEQDAGHLARHSIEEQYFAQLGAGGGGPEVVAMLVSAEYSRRLLLLRAILDRAGEWLEPGPLASPEEAWKTLADLQGNAPDAFSNVLMEPQVGMWLAHCLRRLHGTVHDAYPMWVDLGYVFNVAAAIAANSGRQLRVLVPSRGGAIMLPTLGLVRLDDEASFGYAEVAVDSGVIHVRSQHGGTRISRQETERADWRPLRRLAARSGGSGISVWLDDIDPYRQIGMPVPPDRLPETLVRKWESLFSDAWAIIEQDNPDRAAAMALGFKSIVPLPSWPTLPIRSASSGDSFGSAIISHSADPAQFASTLVHEFQHVKLGGLLHLLSLYREDSRQRLYAPWRDDPRPLSGLLQGVYAFLGVTEFWRAHRLRESPGPARDLAEFEFALWREQTWHALMALSADDGLTHAGRRFAMAMKARMSEWLADHVDPRILAAAVAAAADHRIGWRIRHMRPNAAKVAELAGAFRAGHSARGATQDEYASRVDADPSVPWSHRRLDLTRLRLSGPEEFSRRLRDGAGGNALLAGDLALVSGDREMAADAYVRVLGRAPEHPDAWTGLVLALFARDEASAGSPLRYPEFLPAVQREQRTIGGSADPVMVARWLRDGGW